MSKYFSGKTKEEVMAMSKEERKASFTKPEAAVNPKSLSLSGKVANSQTKTISNSGDTVDLATKFKNKLKEIKSEKVATSQKIMSGMTKSATTKSTLSKSSSLKQIPKDYVKPPKKQIEKTKTFEKPLSASTKSLQQITLPETSYTDFISGTVDYSFPGGVDYGFDGTVYCSLIQPDGKILIGGNFGTYTSPDYPGGYYSPYIIRLNADGTVDDSFEIGYLDDRVQTVALQSDGKILVGGNFTYEDYYSTNPGRILRMLPDGSPDTTFVAGSGFNSLVVNINVQPDDKILVCGEYSSYNSNDAAGFIRLNSNGSVDSSFLHGDSSVSFNGNPIITKIQPDGKILIGGGFSSYSGISANFIIRLNTDGSRDDSFQIGTGFYGNPVWGIDLQSDGKIIVTGDFWNTGLYDNNPCNAIVRLNTDGSLNSTFGFGIYGYQSVVKVQPDDKILVGGYTFDGYLPYYNNSYYETTGNLIRFNADTSFDHSFYYGRDIVDYSSQIYTISLQSDGKILIGGDFYSVGSKLNRFGRLNNAISGYKYVYNMVVNCFGDEKTYSVGSNTLLTPDNDNGNYFSFVSLANSTDVKCGYLQINFDEPIPFAIPEYELVNSYGSNCDDCVGDNMKYVVAQDLYNWFIDGFDTSYNGAERYDFYQGLTGTTNGNGTTAYFSLEFCGTSIINSYIDFGGYGYNEGDTITIKGSQVGGIDGTDDVIITVTSLYGRNEINVNKNFKVGDIFFLNETIVDVDTVFRGCYQIIYELDPYGTSIFTPILYVPYETCEECVQENGMVYVAINANTNNDSFFISHQFVNPAINPLVDGFPSILLPNTDTPCNFIVAAITDWDFADSNYSQLPVVYSSKVFTEKPFFYGFPLCEECMSAVGSGELDLEFNPYYDNNRGFDFLVFASKVQPDDKILVGGWMNTYNDTDLPGGEGIARLNADGTLDTTFNIPYSNSRNIYAIDTNSNGDVFIGGYIETNNIYYGYSWIAQYDGDGDIYTNNNDLVLRGPNDDSGNGWSYLKTQMIEDGSITFNYNYSTNDGPEYDWAFYYVSQDEPIDNTNISFIENKFASNDGDNGDVTITYKAGDWVSLGVYSTDSDAGPGTLYIPISTNLFKVDKNGTPDTTFNINASNFNDGVETIAVQPDGKILVGGYFGYFQGMEVDGFTRLNADGTLDEDFYQTQVFFYNEVYDIKLQDDGKILVGGNFDGLYDQTTELDYDAGYMVRLNSDGSLDISFNCDGNPSTFSTETPFSGVTAQYLRWTITSTKDVSEATQVSELYLTLNDQQFTFGVGATCSNPDGSNPSGEEPEYLIDDNITTKWTDLSFSANGQSVIVINNQVPINFDGYKYYTGNDFPERDPISWTLEISDDGDIWTTVSEVVNATITNDRESASQIFSVTPNVDFGGSISFDGTSFVNANTSDGGVWELGTNNFTFEWFQKFTGDITTQPTVFDYNTGYLTVYFNTNGEIVIFVNGDDYTYTLDTTIQDTWHHFALTREFVDPNYEWRIFQNGILIDTFELTINYGLATPLIIGGNLNQNVDGTGFTGLITNFRVTNLAALYTSNFVVPTEPLPHDNGELGGNTVLLLSVLNEADFILDSSDDNTPTINSGRPNPGFNDYVQTIELDSTGRVLVGGGFDNYNNDNIGYGLARLNTNGSLDDTLETYDGFNGYVYAIAVQSDGKILVGGEFNTYYHDLTWNSYGIIRLMDNGYPDLKFNTIYYGDGTNDRVRTIELMSDGNAVVGGWFGTYYSYGNSFTVGSDGALMRIFTASDYRLNIVNGCDTNRTTSYMYLPKDSTIHTLDNFFTGNEDDTNHVFVFPLDFDVNFLGTDYSSVNISSNAYITFGDGGDPSDCCFSIPSGIPGGPGLPGIYPSVYGSIGDGMDAQLYALYSGLTDNGNKLIIKWEGSYHNSIYRTLIPNLVLNYIFYKDNPYQIDLVIEQNEYFSEGNPTGGVSDGNDSFFLSTFDSSSRKAYTITDSSTITEVDYNSILVGNDILKGDINTTPLVCNTVYKETSEILLESGSIYFANHDYVTISMNDSLKFRTNDFTVEWFQKRIYNGAYQRVFSIGSSSDLGGASLAVYYYDDNDLTLTINGTDYGFGYTGDADDSAWLHMAVTRENNIVRMFRNGVEIFQNGNGSPILSMVDINPNQDLRIANEIDNSSGAQFNGYITNFRWVNGTAIYTSNFNVPMEPLSPTYDTTLLMLVKNSENYLDNTSTYDQDISVSGDIYFDYDSPFKDCCQPTYDDSGYFPNIFNLYNSDGVKHYDTCDGCNNNDGGGKKYTLTIKECASGVVSYVQVTEQVLQQILDNGPIMADGGPECWELLAYSEFLKGSNLYPYLFYTNCTTCLAPWEANKYYEYTSEMLGSFSGGTWDSSLGNAPHAVYSNARGKFIIQMNTIELGGFNGLNN